MEGSNVYIAIDLGAGFGLKLGIFNQQAELEYKDKLALTSIDNNYDKLLAELNKKLHEMINAACKNLKDVRGIGLCSPGLFKSDGTYLVTSGFDFLEDRNFRADIENTMGIPTFIENDATSGALAEWNIFREEIIFWVFGGNWGGSWIDANGKPKYSSLDWDKNDASLHLSDEPGYASSVPKKGVSKIFTKHGFDFKIFEKQLAQEQGKDVVTGPSASPDTIRAEVFSSGRGIVRLFKSGPFAGDSKYSGIDDVGTSGILVKNLAVSGDENALKAYRLFGDILAFSGKIILDVCFKDGAENGVPIIISGGPAESLPFFGAYTQKKLLEDYGITSYLRPSVLFERKVNANLAGAAVLAILKTGGKE